MPLVLHCFGGSEAILPQAIGNGIHLTWLYHHLHANMNWIPEHMGLYRPWKGEHSQHQRLEACLVALRYLTHSNSCSFEPRFSKLKCREVLRCSRWSTDMARNLSRFPTLSVLLFKKSEISIGRFLKGKSAKSSHVKSATGRPSYHRKATIGVARLPSLDALAANLTSAATCPSPKPGLNLGTANKNAVEHSKIVKEISYTH